MSEEQSENKMNRIDIEYKYHVVKFLQNPFKDTERVSCEYVCVPKSWVKWCSPEDNIVRVWYPIQDPGNIEKKVRKREKKSDKWESFLSVLKYSTDMYESAIIYIRNKKNLENNDNEDHTPLSAKVKESPSKTTSSVIQNEAAVENMLDAIGWSVSSKSAKTITLKRKAPADSGKTTHKKQSRVNETGKSVDEIAEPSGQAFKTQTQETLALKSNNRKSKQKKQIVNQNTSKANHSLDPKSVALLQAIPELAECCKSLLGLQKCLGISLVREIINKFMNPDNRESALSDDTNASATIDSTVQAPKLNEEKKHEEQIEDNDSDDDSDDDDDRDEDDCQDDDCDEDDNCDDDQPRTKQDSSKTIKNEARQYFRRIKTFVLPPKYDANDSRWTLKYCKPAPGLVELMENSGVFVRATSLENCHKTTKTSHDFARNLLKLVFTASALRTCSWTGRKPPGSYYSQGTNVRPGLDAHAREVLLNYVVSITTHFDNLNQYRKELIRSMNSYMLKMRP